MISFDVFDTVIVRSWWHPSDVFLACGHDLVRLGLWSESPDTWQTLRQEVELAVRKSSLHEEITLNEIYAEIKHRIEWTSSQMEFAISVELAEEKACFHPVSAARSIITKEPHIFITDTYFQKSFVAERLSELFPQVEQITPDIFCSSEIRKAKHRGSLFPAVLENLALSPSDLHHIGDNRLSDVRMARKIGILATWWRVTIPTEAEIKLRGNNNAPGLIRSALAGVSRAVRLSCPEDNLHLQHVWEIGANYAGPFIFALCTWILFEAKQRGIKRLYFFSRDGQILVRVAEKVARAFGFDIKLQYFYASRQALYFPAITKLRGDEFTERWLHTNIQGKTPRQLLARLQLIPEEIVTLDPALAAMWHDPDVPLPEPDKLLDTLLTSSAMCELVEERAAQSRRILIDYLSQEGLLESGSQVGVVDVGWHGRLQASLQRILDAEFGVDSYPLQGFYAGLRDRPVGAPTSRYIAFADAFALNDCVIESFTMADHGSVAAIYHAPDGRCVPSLQEEHNTESLIWGLSTLQSAIITYADNVARSMTNRIAIDGQVVGEMREAVVPVLSRFCKRPPYELAKALGALSFADDQTHCIQHPIAPEISFANALTALTRRHYHGPGKLWIPGALSRSFRSPFVRNMLLLTYAVRERAKSVLRRWLCWSA